MPIERWRETSEGGAMNYCIFNRWLGIGVMAIGLGTVGGLSVAETQTDVSACEVARRYIGLVNAGRYGEISALFTEDALYLPPTGDTISTRKDIHAFYERFLGDLRPTFRIGRRSPRTL